MNDKVEISKNDISGLILTKLGIAIGKEQGIQEEFDLFLKHTCHNFIDNKITISIDTFWPPPTNTDGFTDDERWIKGHL